MRWHLSKDKDVWGSNLCIKVYKEVDYHLKMCVEEVGKVRLYVELAKRSIN